MDAPYSREQLRITMEMLKLILRLEYGRDVRWFRKFKWSEAFVFHITTGHNIRLSSIPAALAFSFAFRFFDATSIKYYRHQASET